MNRHSHLSALLLTTMLCLSSVPSKAQTPTFQVNPETGETQQQFAARTAWWRQAKFGLFIHWGIYDVPTSDHRNTTPDTLGEWYMYNSRTQVADYEKFAPQFDPVHFDAHAWVATAKAAGMKYIVFTAKHHDGFCMFNTKLTDYNIVKATPWHKDPLKELAMECKKQGLKLCIYYSYMDWHNYDYLPRRPWDTRPTTGASLDKYTDYAEGQLKELLTNYGPIGALWFDGGWEHPPADERSLEVVKMVRKLQPGIIINDRLNPAEDFSTPEQSIPANAFPNGRLWETCMTIVTAHNLHWSYAWSDTNFKSSADLVRKTCDIAGKGGNFLLDVGPDATGVIPDQDLTRLAEVGRWMKANGQSIYGTTKSPFHRIPFDGSCTSKGNTLYLQVFQWPSTGLVLPGLMTPIKKAYLLNGQSMPAYIRLKDGAIEFPRPQNVDSYATVIVLKLKGSPIVDQSVLTMPPLADGSYKLNAEDATLSGQSAMVEKTGGVSNIGYWTSNKDVVAWNISVPAAGSYSVALNYACPPDSAGTVFALTASPFLPPGVAGTVASSITGTVTSTRDWGTFQTVTLPDPLKLNAGSTVIRIAPQFIPKYAVMNLRSITLTPVRSSN